MSSGSSSAFAPWSGGGVGNRGIIGDEGRSIGKEVGKFIIINGGIVGGLENVGGR